MLFPLIVARNEALPLVRIGGTSLKPESLPRICAPSCVPLLWPRPEASASDVAASANTTSAPIAQVRRIGTPPFVGGKLRSLDRRAEAAVSLRSSPAGPPEPTTQS